MKINTWRDVPPHQRKRIRQDILRRDAYTCHYCGADATTVDHVIAIANGGSPYDYENMVAACERCNYSKGANDAPKSLTRVNKPRQGRFFSTPFHPTYSPAIYLSPTKPKQPPTPFERPESN